MKENELVIYTAIRDVKPNMNVHRAKEFAQGISERIVALCKSKKKPKLVAQASKAAKDLIYGGAVISLIGTADRAVTWCEMNPEAEPAVTNDDNDE